MDSQNQPGDTEGLSVIEQARMVELKDVLAWVSRKTIFTTGKPWVDSQASDQPIRMACQDILRPPKEPKMVALSPSPFLLQLAQHRAADVRKGTRAAEPKHIARSGFSKKDMSAYIFTSPDIQPAPLKAPDRKPKWLGECDANARLFALSTPAKATGQTQPKSGSTKKQAPQQSR